MSQRTPAEIAAAAAALVEQSAAQVVPVPVEAIALLSVEFMTATAALLETVVAA